MRTAKFVVVGTLVALIMGLLAGSAFGHGGEDLIIHAKGKEVFQKKTLKGSLILGARIVSAKKAVKKGNRHTAVASSPVGMSLVRDVPGYETLLVSDDIAYAVLMSDRSRLYKSSDRGATWSEVHKFSSRVWTLSPGEPNLLFASENDGSAGGQIIWRSADGGNTWTAGSFQDPANLSKYNPSLTSYAGSQYQLLTGHSIAQFRDGTLLLGTYISGNLSTYPTVIYRSRDGGNTWQVAQSDLANPQHRHPHGIEVDPATQVGYIFYGDSAGRDGIWETHDQGSTSSPSCTGQSDNRCIVIAAAFRGNTAISGSDNAFGGNSIDSFNMLTHAVQQLVVGMSYPSYSALQTSCGPSLVATLYEGAGSWINNDHFRRVYAVTSDNTVTDVLDYAIATNPSNPAVPVSYPQGIYLVGEYSDGTIAVQVTSHGTVFTKLTGTTCDSTTTPPSNSIPPQVGGTTQEGSILGLTPGTWSGTPAPTLSYQWLRCDNAGANCNVISGSNTTSYTLVTSDAGSTVKARVTATNSAGSASADSSATGVIATATTTPPATGTVQHDASAAWTGYGTSSTQSFTVGNNSNRELLVFVEREYRPGVNNVGSVKYNNIPLTRLISAGTTSSADNEVWYLLNPDTGVHPLVLDFGGGTAMNYRWGASSYYGAAQSAPSNIYNSGLMSSSANSAVNTLAGTASGSLVVDFLGGSGISLTSVNPGIGQTQSLSITDRPGVGAGYGNVTSSYKTGGGNVSTQETASTGSLGAWAYMQVELVAAAVDGSTTTTTTTVTTTSTPVVAAADSTTTTTTTTSAPPVAPPPPDSTPPTAVPANLAPDPDFESDPNASYFTNGTGTFSWVTDQSHSAAHSLKIVSNSSGLSRWLSNTSAIPATAGKTYTASVWVKTSAVAQYANLSINFWTGTTAYTGYNYDSTTVTGSSSGWTQLTVSGLAPAGTASVRAEFRLYGPGTMWADDLLVGSP